MSAGLTNIPTMIALAVLVERLGGEVTISQEDIDRVAYSRLLEGWAGRDLALKLEHKTGAVPS